MNASEVWICDECGEAHNDEDDAADCCRPSVWQKWKCGKCDGIHNNEPDAVTCCADDAEENGEPLSPDVYQQRVAQLEAKGQRRLIP
jgi:hypothetical protein